MSTPGAIVYSAVLLVVGLLAASQGVAQIYACKADDGSRVFSDKRCGDDAKVVPGTSRSKKTSSSASKPKPKPVPDVKPAGELDELLKRCDAGDVASCNAWTLGGGPTLLRQREEQAELDCEAGSLSACEERYCRDGMDDDCRARVLRTARLAGDTCYMREEHYRREDAVTAYAVRCFQQGTRKTHDITLMCSAQAGPNRCYQSDPQQGFARLDQAAAKYCAG
jgi:Domain of unknown function (DUF4124)